MFSFRVISAVILIGIGLVIGFFLPSKSELPCGKKAMDHKLLDPAAFCDTYVGTSAYADLRRKLYDTIQTATEKKDINLGALFFIDLTSKESVGVREILKFAPASLVKLPVAIGIYHIAETHPEILLRTVIPRVGDITNDVSQNIPPINKLEVGKPYTIEELIRHMLEDSSNDALHLLNNNLTKDEIAMLDNTAFDLGLVLPDRIMQDPAMENILSTRLMTNMMRIMYAASYLNVEHSETILHMLSKSTFDGGLERGIPKDVILANKFGERSRMEGVQSDLQLHDCGIVYHPKRPYALCIMTTGTDFQKMADTIAKLSKITYDFVDGVAKEN